MRFQQSSELSLRRSLEASPQTRRAGTGGIAMESLLYVIATGDGARGRMRMHAQLHAQLLGRRPTRIRTPAAAAAAASTPPPKTPPRCAL